jgi:DNA-binding response OmpR family regulator
MAVIEKQASSPAMVEPASLTSVGVCSGQAQAMRIVLVEPDSDYRADLAAQLWKRGIAVRGFDDAVALLTTLDALDDADVIVASWGMPKMSGLELSSRLRRLGIEVPMVLLAGRAQSGRECLAVDPDTGKVAAKTRGVEALVGHLRSVIRTFEKRPSP